MSAVSLRPKHPGRYDFGKRRKAKRAGAERGCWVYIPAEELANAKIDPYGETPWYRIWASPYGRIRIQLYKSG